VKLGGAQDRGPSLRVAPDPRRTFANRPAPAQFIDHAVSLVDAGKEGKLFQLRP
jgi:hypothetical protein